MWCITTAKDFVPAGTPFQVMGGEIFEPSQVYLDGNVPLFVNAEFSAFRVLVFGVIVSMVSCLHENKILISMKGMILNNDI